jgi:hypothetical protein
MNVCTWLAAVLLGRTHQLRSSWFLLLASLKAGTVAERYPWGHDLGFVGALGLPILGLPSSLIAFLVLRPLTSLTRSIIRELTADALIVMIPYIQAFILLPRIFRDASLPQAGSAGKPDKDI